MSIDFASTRQLGREVELTQTNGFSKGFNVARTTETNY